MENIKINSMITHYNGNQVKEKSTNYPKLSTRLMKLFKDEIKEISWAEKY